MIPWLRLWSKELANALIDRRDNQALSQAALAGRHAWDTGDNIFLGSQLSVTLGGEGMILYEAEPSTKASFSLREIDLGLKVWGFGFILDAQSNVPPPIPIALTSVKF